MGTRQSAKIVVGIDKFSFEEAKNLFIEYKLNLFGIAHVYEQFKVEKDGILERYKNGLLEEVDILKLIYAALVEYEFIECSELKVPVSGDIKMTRNLLTGVKMSSNLFELGSIKRKETIEQYTENAKHYLSIVRENKHLLYTQPS